MFIWKIVLKNLVLPPTGPLLLALAGLGLTARSRLRRLGLSLCATGVLLLWLLATPLMADTLVRWAEKYPALDLSKSVDAQAIVILAGGVRVDAPEYGSSAPGATTLERLVYGARVARATGLPILVSGSRYEAAAMEDFLRRDLALRASWVENRSRDTHENARKSALILVQAGVHRVVLVTSAAHMARSVMEFEQAGIAVIPAPAAMWTLRDRGITGWIPNVDALTRSQRALYEALGRAVLAARRGLTLLGVMPAERPVSGV